MANSLGHLLRVFLPFALGYFLSYLFRTINAVIAPDLVRDIGLDPASLGLLTSVYLLAFGAFQLPLGLLLDRFGPRRVEAGLLTIAAAGAFLFSQATSFTGLLVGRALIGLGVSACLMAAFKAFSLWFEPRRLPFANGVQMVSGGLGALAATRPVEAALQITDWRGVFLFIAGLTLVAAIVIFFVVPERNSSQPGEPFNDQLRGIGTVLRSRYFWRIAPWAFTAQAAYLSIYGLWSGPWLRDVAGFERDAVANTLLAISVAMICGYFAFGALAERLSRRGLTPLTTAATGLFLFLAAQSLLLLPFSDLALLRWLLFGFFGTAAILPYAILSQHFPPNLTGRANTALNLLVFFAAFSAQWGIGVIIDFWPTTETGGYAVAGYRAGFGTTIILQILAIAWFIFSAPDNTEDRT
ncbi:MAG: MFS transporter [Desulfuromonas sp.]|nr:MAG: MFS transporter [Desulfuromonas sp.]